MMTPIKDTILVKQEQTHKDTIGSFELDALYDPTAHINTTVEVVDLPRGASPDYASDIEKMEVGDRLVVNWKMFDNNDMDFGQEFRYEDDIYACPVRWVYLIIKPDDTIIPMSKHVLAEYVYADNVEWTTDPETGSKVRAVLASWDKNFVVDPNPQPLEDRALVLAESTGLLEGEVIHHAKHADMTYDVLGEEKLIIGRELIYGSY